MDDFDKHRAETLALVKAVKERGRRARHARLTRKKPKAAKAGKAKRRKRRQALPVFRGTYRDYLASSQWREKRRRLFKARGERCEVCGASTGLSVHHKHYRTLFRETNADLEVLCQGCHENHHEGHRGIVADPMTREFLALEL